MITISIPLEITTPNKRYAPVGKCIYCGEVPFSDEHIIPFALAGDAAILPAASCKHCAKITGKIEHKIFRNMIGNTRIKLGAPTRRPKDRPKEIKVRVGKWAGGSVESPGSITPTGTITIDASNVPLLYPALKFPRMGCLLGRDPDWDVSYDVTMLQNIDEIRGALGNSANALQSEMIYPFEFAQALAKIAHSYAVAELGLDGFRPFLTDLILGKTPYKVSHALHWIGSEPTIAPVEASVCTLAYEKFDQIDHLKRPVMVKLRIFPCLPTPTYQVLVGEW